jgi:hypothetical protein
VGSVSVRVRHYFFRSQFVLPPTRLVSADYPTLATLSLLPAALSHAIGSDSQRPFVIVIVGGLIVHLMSTFLLPTFYLWYARPTDRLPTA